VFRHHATHNATHLAGVDSRRRSHGAAGPTPLDPLASAAIRAPPTSSAWDMEAPTPTRLNQMALRSIRPIPRYPILTPNPGAP